MGHTNSTANIALPQFIGTDKPTWLGDVNGAFAAIDSKVGTIDADVAATDAKADNAVADAASAVATATSANTTAGNASTTATNALNIANNALTVANNSDGHTNQLETKVGLLADLHTTDKTSIVNAINEVADAGGSTAFTLIGSETGTTHISINSGYNEIVLIIKYADNSTFSIYIPAIMLTAAAQAFETGYADGTTFYGVITGVSDSEAYLTAAMKGSTDEAASTVISVYGR